MRSGVTVEFSPDVSTDIHHIIFYYPPPVKRERFRGNCRNSRQKLLEDADSCGTIVPFNDEHVGATPEFGRLERTSHWFEHTPPGIECHASVMLVMSGASKCPKPAKT